jgi:hypothetical protein
MTGIRSRHDSAEALAADLDLIRADRQTEFAAWMVENHDTGETWIVSTEAEADGMCEGTELCAYGLDSDPREK